MRPVTSDDVYNMGLLSNTTDYPKYYEMLGEPDTFRVLPALATTAYTIKFRIWYMESVIDLVSDDLSPNDTDDPTLTTGVGQDDMAIESVGTVAAKYEFNITTGGATDPNVFKWRKDGGDWTVDINVATTAVTISDGLTVSWGLTTGHTANDTWTVYQDDPQIGSVPLKFRKAIWRGAAAEILAEKGDERWQKYEGEFQRLKQACKREANIDHYAKPYRIRVTK